MINMTQHHKSSEYAIEAEGLVKHFGKTRAVDGVDLRVRAGSVYGVLGPNGAGKTTTVRMLATLLTPDAGRATVLGHDLAREGAALRRRISLTGQFASVDEDLTGRENLMLLAKLLGFKGADVKRRSDALLEAFDLADAANKQAKSYSGGMRRRLDIAASLVVVPDLLFLDEPTTGLDPRSRNQVWDIIRALVSDGTTVLLTTQYLEEADELADRIAVIDHGKVIAEGTSAELKASVGSGTLHVTLKDPTVRARAMALLAEQLGSAATAAATDEASFSVAVSDPALALAALSALQHSGLPPAAFSLGQPSLDEVFFALTGHAAEPQSEEDSAGTGESKERQS
jgi:ABC-2 type transport system ATP-binding protein